MFADHVAPGLLFLWAVSVHPDHLAVAAQQLAAPVEAARVYKSALLHDPP